MNTNPAIVLPHKFSSLTKWLYLMLLSLIWGGSFILIKKGLTGLCDFAGNRTVQFSLHLQLACRTYYPGGALLWLQHQLD